MRKLLLGLLLSLMCWGSAPAQQSVFVPATTASVTFSAITAITQLVPAIAGQRIYITNITAHPAATSVLTLSYGTGTNCGTGTVNFYSGTFQAGENVYDGVGNGAIFVIPAGNALCVTIATATATGWVSYSQF
jgi:hypothetical protein